MKEELLKKEDRLKIYKAAMEIFEKESITVGICTTLEKALTSLHYDIEVYSVWIDHFSKTLFPEFWTFKPRKMYRNSNYWWALTQRGYNRRLEILRKLANGEINKD